MRGTRRPVRSSCPTRFVLVVLALGMVAGAAVQASSAGAATTTLRGYTEDFTSQQRGLDSAG